VGSFHLPVDRTFFPNDLYSPGLERCSLGPVPFSLQVLARFLFLFVSDIDSRSAFQELFLWFFFFFLFQCVLSLFFSYIHCGSFSPLSLAERICFFRAGVFFSASPFFCIFPQYPPFSSHKFECVLLFPIFFALVFLLPPPHPLNQNTGN